MDFHSFQRSLAIPFNIDHGFNFRDRIFDIEQNKVERLLTWAFVNIVALLLLYERDQYFNLFYVRAFVVKCAFHANFMSARSYKFCNKNCQMKLCLILCMRDECGEM